MNPLFLPTDFEKSLIQIIQNYCRHEFALVRMTDTMLKKGIIDASEEIRLFLKTESIIDFEEIIQGEKRMRNSTILLSEGPFLTKCSFYRPRTKNGDPRFWVYGLKQLVDSNTLVYLTFHKKRIIVIPLINHPDFKRKMKVYFGDNKEEEQMVKRFRDKISAVAQSGWVMSVSPYKLNDKDIGETLERELGIQINNLKTPDFEGGIEVKGKKINSKTKDTLFSMVPNWQISTVKSSNEMALNYGYEDREYEGYKALFVTVSQKPNAQGLFLEVDEENEMIHQKCLQGDKTVNVCSWKFEDIMQRLNAKHPKTMWVVAEHTWINSMVYFKYIKVEYSRDPIFTQFLYLVQEGIITFDWRRRADMGAKVKLGSSKIDYGQGFRIDPRNRKLLFGEVVDFRL
ncbi:MULTISPECIES: MvaI/BcnI family restriction endonuclease [unclassified Exiguobacterium]|uniref:MvaI/BcnI family restriction endonuclease n=1 Tax=unclassified Exiguobacterium TaxID=2644629 RepID=UPI001BE74B48|nr:MULTISPECIES: MvaI/BcnI family restriction endonuclease [unclassified Exiguobacterium]